MKKLLFILLLLVQISGNAQFNRGLLANVARQGSTTGGYVRQNLRWDNSFAGTVATTTGFPGSSGMPTNGWNTLATQYLFGYGNSSQSCCTYSVSQASDFPYKQPYALKFELRNTDPVVSSSNRTEVTVAGAYSEGVVNHENWYGLSFYLKSWATDVCCESIWQWHDVGSSPDLCPPLSIQTDGGGGINLVTAIGCSVVPYSIGSLSGWNDRWVDVVLHVKWDTGTAGIVECWVDGVKKVTLTGQKTQSNGGSYIKLGLNKFGGFTNVTKREFEIANFRVGNASATYADVAP